jgi:hypothetical protein
MMSGELRGGSTLSITGGKFMLTVTLDVFDTLICIITVRSTAVGKHGLS